MQHSIRNELLGALHPFCKSAGFREIQTNEVLTDLVFYLSEYREEEVPLFPEVYLTEGGKEVFMEIAPAGERVSIGSCEIEAQRRRC